MYYKIQLITYYNTIHQLLLSKTQYDFLVWLKAKHIINDNNFVYQSVKFFKKNRKSYYDLTESAKDNDERKVIIFDDLKQEFKYYLFSTSQTIMLDWIIEYIPNLHFEFIVIDEKNFTKI